MSGLGNFSWSIQTSSPLSSLSPLGVRCFILFTKLNLIIHLIILFYTKRKALSIQSKLFQFGLGCILSAAKFLASLAIAENLIVISAGTFCCIVSADEKCKEHNKGLGFRFDDDSKKNLNLPQPEPTSSSLGWAGAWQWNIPEGFNAFSDSLPTSSLFEWNKNCTLLMFSQCIKILTLNAYYTKWRS